MQTIQRRDQILSTLRALIHDDDEVLVIHSSLSHLGLKHKDEVWDFIYALKALVLEGKTIALPTFTFSFCGQGHVDFSLGRSETGALGELCLTLDGAKRTPHPIYSFCLLGPRSTEILSAANTTTFGDDSVFAIFEQVNARIIMLGCDWKYCTLFHRYEELAQVPYRTFKTFTGSANYSDGFRPTEATMYVRRLDINAENNFDAVVKQFDKSGALHSLNLFDGNVQSMPARQIAEICTSLLQTDLYSFVENSRLVQFQVDALNARSQQPSLKIAVLGSSNLDSFNKIFASILQQHLPDRQIDLFELPYGQTDFQLLNPTSELHHFQPDFIFHLDRIEDLLQVPRLAGDENHDLSKLNQRISAISRFSENCPGLHVLVRYPSSQETSYGSFQSINQTDQALLTTFNSALIELSKSNPKVISFDLSALLAQAQVPLSDPRLWFIGRIPFSAQFNPVLARKLCGIVLAHLGRTARLLVLDLDNTLWGGVLGEDGLDGIALGGDYPGNAFKHFQQIILELSQRGIALALCSKNDNDHALHAISTHKDMVLKPDLFVAKKINWQPKWQNISQISEEVSLGLANILFIDDNPIEREHVSRQLPQVKVLDLPTDPALYVNALLSSPYLECISITDEDKKRTQTYQARQKVIAEQASFESVEDFYASLQTTVVINEVEESTLVRTVQLFNKTNQFNTTTRRYSRDDVLARASSETSSIYVIASKDRFSELENIGVLSVNWNKDIGLCEIDDFLMSCRVLGRGIETGVLGWLAQQALERGYKTLSGEIIETERNTPVREIYKKHGFSQHPETSVWLLDLTSNKSCTVPNWINISS